MKAVTFDKVSLGGFWKNRFEINKNATIPMVYDRFSDTGRFDAFKFEWKDGDPNRPHIFWDSDIAKWIEAVAYTIHLCPDKKLEAVVDGVVDLIEKNRDENGYFNIYFTVCEPDNRFVNRMAHELYCAGHLTEAAIAYYKATGKDKFLHLMCDYMDYIEKVFFIEDSAEFSTPGHEEIELALVKLYDCTGNEKYLEMSSRFVETRGTSEKDEESPYYISHAYDQSHKPVREQERATGHSVRATYLYCAMADLALRMKDDSLYDACRRLFLSIAEKQMYVTGGIGSTHYGERFTEDYDLPNDVAYSETCASIGLALFARRMSLIEPDSLYADIAEIAIYNCALAGVSLSGKAFFYVNPLEINMERNRKNIEYYQYKGSTYDTPQRLEVFDCSCCPPNIARMIASIGDILYTYNDDTVFVHHYFESQAEFEGIKITQNTEYPNNGAVKLTVRGMAGKTLAVRIPGWAENCTVSGAYKTEKGYAYIEIKDDETEINLDFAMECRLVCANPTVEADVGRVALCRGPLVYCAEKIDNGVPLNNLSICENLNASVSFNEEMQAYTVEADGFEDAPADSLYRTYRNDGIRRRIKLIPYFAFANRGASDMLVWLRIK
ncbi:MAG: glycoside hydrolase family 127 protein [Ruminococcaceae bacterium]|nr:glycoside hydrolase family 127 protein [Oscillospiraceae bacterium]